MPPSCDRNNPDFGENLNERNTAQEPSCFKESGETIMAESGQEISPHENDILMGRGGKNNQHVGNEKLRSFARLESANYRIASKKGKSHISRELVKKIRLMDPPGRFLKKKNTTGSWEDVGDDVAREKASQVLRDAVSIRTQHAPSKHQPTGDISCDARHSASAPPIMKQPPIRRLCDEAGKSQIMPLDFYNPFPPSDIDKSSKRRRYHASNTWDEHLTQYPNITRHPTSARHSFQLNHMRTHSPHSRSFCSWNPVRRINSKGKSPGSINSSVDEFTELFQGELINSDEEGNGSDSDLSLNAHGGTF